MSRTTVGNGFALALAFERIDTKPSRHHSLRVPFRVLDHTADYMVEASGATLSELFADAARALFDTLTDVDAVRPVEERVLRVEAESREELLVSWLSELLFLYESERWLFSRFEPKLEGDGRLEARVWGERLDADRHPIDREIKAVTYHRIGLTEDEHGWKTTIVFDL